MDRWRHSLNKKVKKELNKAITMKKSAYLFALTLGASSVTLAQNEGIYTDSIDTVHYYTF